MPVTLELICEMSVGCQWRRLEGKAYAEEFAVCQHALFEAGCEEVNVILHQLIHCPLRGAWCRLVIWACVWLVFRGMQAAHECPPIRLDDFGCAEVQELLHENEHAGAVNSSVVYLV